MVSGPQKAFAAALTLLVASPSHATAQRSAFFCLMFERTTSPSGGREASAQSPLRHLNFLLSASAEGADPNGAIETFDPTNILEGERFLIFQRGDGDRAGGFAVLTGRPNGPDTYMLVLAPRAEERQFAAGIAFGSERARFVGRCLYSQNDDTVREFERMKAEEQH